MSFRFRKGERLKSRKIISRLFNREGKSFAKYPLRAVWLETPLDSDFPIQFTVSVPKRHFKSAVKRNRIKRLTREAFRLHKKELCDALQSQERQVALMMLYTAKEELPYSKIEQRMLQILGELKRITR